MNINVKKYERTPNEARLHKAVLVASLVNLVVQIYVNSKRENQRRRDAGEFHVNMADLARGVPVQRRAAR